MPFEVIALVGIEPGQEDAFITAARTCAAASRLEPGVLRYQLWRETVGERRFVFEELYVDQAAVDRHLASEHFRTFDRVTRPFATAAPTVITASPIDVL